MKRMHVPMKRKAAEEEEPYEDEGEDLEFVPSSSSEEEEEDEDEGSGCADEKEEEEKHVEGDKEEEEEEEEEETEPVEKPAAGGKKRKIKITRVRFAGTTRKDSSAPPLLPSPNLPIVTRRQLWVRTVSNAYRHADAWFNKAVSLVHEHVMREVAAGNTYAWTMIEHAPRHPTGDVECVSIERVVAGVRAIFPRADVRGNNNTVKVSWEQ